MYAYQLKHEIAVGTWQDWVAQHDGKLETWKGRKCTVIWYYLAFSYKVCKCRLHETLWSDVYSMSPATIFHSNCLVDSKRDWKLWADSSTSCKISTSNMPDAWNCARAKSEKWSMIVRAIHRHEVIRKFQHQGADKSALAFVIEFPV